MSPDTRPRRGRARLKLPKWLTRPARGVVALLLLGLLALWYVAETDFTAERVRRLLQARGEALLGVPLSIGRLELDLLPPRLVAVDVRAEGRAQADRVVLELDPMGLLRNRLALANVELHRPRIVLDLQAALSTGARRAPAPVQFELRRLLVRDGEVSWGGQAARVDGELLGIAAQLAPESDDLLATAQGAGVGELRITDGRLRLRQPDGSAYDLAPIELRARYGLAASALRIDDLHLVAGASSIDATGTVRGMRTANLQLAGDLAVADIFRFWVPPGPAEHDGRARFRGSLQLRDGSPVLSGRVEALAAVMGGLQVDSLSAGLEIHRDAVALRSLTASLYGGNLTGEVYVDRRQDPPRVRIDYQASDIDAATLTRWQMLRGWRLAGKVEARGNVAWSRPFRETADGDGHLALRVGVAPNAPALRQPLVPVLDSHDAGERAGHPVPALPIPASVTVDYRVDGGALQLEQATLQVRGATVETTGRLDLDGSVNLGVRLEGDDLALVDHLVAQYRAFRYRQVSARRLGLSGSGAIDLQVTGTVAEPLITGAARGRGVAVDDLALGDVSASLRTDGRTLIAEHLVLTRGGGTAAGTASLRLAGGILAPGMTDYDVRLQLDGYGVTAQRGLSGMPYGAAASVRGPFRIRGAWRRPPSLEFDIRADDPIIGTVRLDELQLRGRRAEGAWILDRFQAGGLGGRIEGSGLWGIAEPRLVLDAIVAGLDLEQACAAVACQQTLAGRLDGRARLAGLLDDLGGEVEAMWSDALIEDLPLGRIVAAARGEAGVFAARLLGSERGESLPIPEVPRTTAPGTAPTLLPEPSQGWSMALTAGTRAPWPLAIRARASAGVVVGLLGQLRRPLPAGLLVSGQLDARARGDLWAWGGWQGEATVSGMRLQREPSFLATSDRVEATLRDGTLHTAAVVQTDAGALDVGVRVGTQDGALDGHLNGRLDLGALRLWSSSLSVAGSVEADVRLAGTVEEPIVTGSGIVRNTALDDDWMYAVTEARCGLELLANEVRIDGGSGLLGGRAFRLSGTIPLAMLAGDPDAAANLRLEMSDLDVAPLIGRSPALSQLISGGAIAGALQLEARSANWREWAGDLDIEALTLRMRDYRLDLDQPIRARLYDAGIDIPAGTTLTDARTRLGLEGRVELAPLALDLTARGSLGFEPLNVLSARWGAGGVADVDLRIRGEVDDLTWRGSASVREAVVSPPVLRQPIDDIRAEVTFDDRRIRIASGEGQLGGGKVVLGGEVLLRNNDIRSFRLTAIVASSLLRLERDVQVRASANVVHDGTPQRSLLSGTVRLEEGLYRRDLQPDTALLEMLEAPDADPDPLLQSITLSLRLIGERDLIIDNNLANVEVTADLDVRGTAAQPVLLGRSVVRSGRLFWNATTFDVLQGTIEYSNPFETDPIFDIRSRTEIRRYTIDLSFHGSLRRGVRFSYTSTPPLSEFDLFNLLAFNEEPGSTVLEDPTAYQQALGLQATRYLTDAYLSEVERGAARLFGIDRFRIAPTMSGTDTDATARLTVGKRVNRNLYVTYSRLLSNSEDQLLTVEYQLSPDIRLKGTREEDGSFGIDFFVQRRIR